MLHVVCSQSAKPSVMTKRDLVVRISEETGLVQQEVLNVVQKTSTTSRRPLPPAKLLNCAILESFEVKVRKARIGRNPNQPEKDVPIPRRAVVKFKPGKEMREAVPQAFAGWTSGWRSQIGRTTAESALRPLTDRCWRV